MISDTLPFTPTAQTLYRPTSGDSHQLARQLYQQMVLIRAVEQKLLDLFAQGLINGTVHTSLGQEACAVGIVNALDRDRDVIFSNHRAHGHYIAYCDDVEGLVAEIMGRRTGVCGGVGGSQHLYRRNLYTNGIQGGIVPLAVGAALAEKHTGTGAISVVFLGDGTLAQGTVYEGMNVASLWSLPVLFVLENNQYAQSTPTHMEHAGDLSTRSASFGIESARLDVRNVMQVHDAARVAVDRVRTSGRPFFLALNTYRLGPHSKGDDTRPREEIDAFWAKDPLAQSARLVPDDARAGIELEVAARVEQAVAEALLAPPLTLDEFRGHLA
jgi:TPP-dependent pyruvate/acetoin dehydrogenase alpha subunit